MSSTSYATPVRAAAPIRPIAYATPDIACARDADGTVRLWSRQPLADYEPSLAKLFRSAVAAQPGRIALAERQNGGWRTLRYEQARPIVDAIAAALLERGLSAERPVMILSGNAIDHALLMLAGYTAGVPVTPVSVAYSLQSQDHEKLKHIVKLI